MELTRGTWRVTVERLPPTSTELVSMYDAAGAYWHPTMERLGYTDAYGALFARLRDAGLLTVLVDGARVLDCGIGTAALSLALLDSSAPALRLTGADLSAGMLRAARRGLAQRGMQASLCRSDARRLPFGDGTFDLVISAHMLEYIPDPATAIRELARVLRPGASLVLIVTRRGLADALLRWQWRYTLIAPTAMARWLDEAGVVDVRSFGLPAVGLLPPWLGLVWTGRKAAALH